jgi:uncharacterized membrane protein
MWDEVIHAWRHLSTTFWFLPSILTLAALFIAPGLIQLDEHFQASGRSLEWLDWVYGGGLQGARRLLSAIAAAMMAISTVMFSSQTTALTFIGQEYGSRLLRNFLADARNQLAFGIYISTFIYALMVLRTIHKDPNDAPVPHLAVAFAIILAIMSLGLLIYSMYHISRFLQASTILDYAARDLERTVRRLTGEPDMVADDAAARDCRPHRSEFDFAGTPLIAEQSGYITRIEEKRLLKLCRDREARIRLTYRVGDFVVAGTAVGNISLDEERNTTCMNQATRCIVLAAEPTIDQDIRHAANQIVQMALRAASTDRNDTLTAIMCLDRMGSALCLLARRRPRSPMRCDSSGVPRLWIDNIGFTETLDTCCRPLREYRDASPSLLAHMLTMLGVIATVAHRTEDLDSLRREADFIWEVGCAKDPTQASRKLLQRHYSDLHSRLGCPDALPDGRGLKPYHV